MNYYKNTSLEDIKYLDENGVEQIEVWKEVEGYEGVYEISNLGRIKSLSRTVPSTNGSFRTKKEKILKQYNNNYLTVNFYENKKNKLILIHRLVAKAFIKNLNNKKQVNHINGIKTDNRVENLEWSTAKENINHSWKNNLSKSRSGEKHHNSKLTHQDVINIKEMRKTNTAKQIAIIYNIHENHVYRILNGTRWK